MSSSPSLATIDNDGIVSTVAPLCLNCGSEGDVLHRDVRDSEFGIGGSWSTRRCPNTRCGMCWIDPRPLDTELVKLYQNYWTHAPDGDDASPLPVPAQRVHTGRKLIKNILAAAFFWRRDGYLADDYYLGSVPPGRLLDVGCGNGEFIARMAGNGWDVLGIDFDEDAVMHARRYAGVEARVGDLLSQGFDESSFDAILLSNVIEHLPNPKDVFAECRRVLKPRGRLVMITPNEASLGHARFGKFWRGLEAPRHLWIFNCRVLKQFALRAGLTRITTFSTPGPVAAIGYVIDGSRRAALSAETVPPAADPRRMMLSERLLDTLGVTRGEWAVLIASK